MEKIEIGKTDKGWRLLNPLTKKQRTILQEIELTEDDLKAYIFEAQESRL
jgi:hypothetical protein